MKAVVFMLGLLLVADVQAETQGLSQRSGLIPDQPPFALTLAQAKAWTPHGATASKANISQVPLAVRLPAPLNAAQAQNHPAHTAAAPADFVPVQHSVAPVAAPPAAPD